MLKAGILFGGTSREREISFAGGRTVYDNLNKSLFEPVPIFIDSKRNFILLDWQYIYKGTIRDFYPPVDVLPPSPHDFQVYVESLGALSPEEQDLMIAHVGRRVRIEELPQLMDVAFLALHGHFGEDGQLQGLLESLNIPYTGSGIRPSAIGMDKAFQKKIMEAAGFPCPKVMVLERARWERADLHAIYQEAVNATGFPIVVRPANQGSSIGVSIVGEQDGFNGFCQAVNRAFFREIIHREDWLRRSPEQRESFVRELTDIRSGTAFPVEAGGQTIFHPEALLDWLNTWLVDHAEARLESHHTEHRVIIEAFIHGREFSCIVIRKENGEAVALPPTEIVKGKEVFDYRSKYLPGLSRKVTPIQLPDADINAIRNACERLFHLFEFNVYARIDGFITADGTIYLNDPNTTSGMLPSSFFFHQAAEIGLNPSQFLTYIIRTSLQERINTTFERTHFQQLLDRLDQAIASLGSGQAHKKKIAVLLGGYSSERHISVESGRNIFEKLSSSEKYEPVPVFLTGNASRHELYQLPINLLLKDNADDIRDKIHTWHRHPVVEAIKASCADITRKYASSDVVFEPLALSFEQLATRVDGVFIALHGRPGEDGAVQKKLDALGVPYNGSGFESSAITINKYETLQRLREHGFKVADQQLVWKKDFLSDPQTVLLQLERHYAFPFIAKPVDDGCSSAVKKIRNREQLKAFLEAIFRDTPDMPPALETTLQLKPKEEFPQKDCVLIENLITDEGARHFLEITGGLLTHFGPAGEIEYEIFEPSEALAEGDVLSLEEKFLAGEGQNITPARFAKTPDDYAHIAKQVKADLERAARILKVTGYARIDAFVRIYDDRRAETIIIEVNSLPGMTPATCIFHQSAINGYKPYHFIDQILEFGFQRKQSGMLVRES